MCRHIQSSISGEMCRNSVDLKAASAGLGLKVGLNSYRGAKIFFIREISVTHLGNVHENTRN